MDRDVLLFLLLIGVLLNTTMLVAVAMLRAAGPARPAAYRHASASGSRALPPRYVPVERAAPSPAARGGWVPVPAAPGAVRLPGDPAPGAPPTTSQPPQSGAEEVAAAADAADEPAEATPAPPVAAEPAERPAEASTPPDPGPARALTQPRPGRRPRRFTMPALDEDHDRATRSIAAFLGEPVAQSVDARPHRRRHRARRPAGGSVRSDLVLVLAGGPPGGRVGHAMAAALRDTVRESDEIVELPGGRLRVSLDADPEGADAFMTRARVVVRPWLELLGPSLELRVERPGQHDRRESAAS
ncbi:MAG TPA: hypothetical protein VM344_03465 [Vitreimonas sp.]|nr:hypothetical protein [Vitreimonas sp.]